MNREQWLAMIRSHIECSGHHVTVVKMSATPRFGYTIGLTEAGLPELVVAGAMTLSAREVGAALNAGTLVAHDPTLEPVVALAVGETIMRAPGGPWEPWT